MHLSGLWCTHTCNTYTYNLFQVCMYPCTHCHMHVCMLHGPDLQILQRKVTVSLGLSLHPQGEQMFLGVDDPIGIQVLLPNGEDKSLCTQIMQTHKHTHRNACSHNGQIATTAGMLMPANRIILRKDFTAKHFLLIRFLNLRDELPFSGKSCH